MPHQTIDLSAAVQAERERCAENACSAFDDLLSWLAGAAQTSTLYDFERELLARLMSLGGLLVAVWLALRLPTSVAATMTHARASYRFREMAGDVVRTRFGEAFSLRPVFERVHGQGPASLSPADRSAGLADGRMSLGVHLLAAWLAAKMAFDEVGEVIRQFGEYAPSKRAILGIVDRVGSRATALLADMPAPTDDGEILVIQNDDKGAPMLGSEEHKKRCQPHEKRRGKGGRSDRRRRRRATHRVRRPRGKNKTKNARMNKVFVIYTLRRNPDGTLDGPINKRVIATFKSRHAAFAMALTEALKRGYGKKPTYFLADGSKAIWTMQQEFFPLAIPCVDWYHVCEYLWKAGGTVLEEGSAALGNWVHARKVELMAGRLDAMFKSMAELRAQIPETNEAKGPRERMNKSIGYLKGQRERLRYRELARADMDIATGAAEGAVNHVVGKRLDGSMMRWTQARAENVVAIRCVIENGLWDHFAQSAAEAHQACRDPVIRRITPDRPQVPYDAVRKAA